MNAKKKGSAGERELLHLLEAHGIQAHRNNQAFIGGQNGSRQNGYGSIFCAANIYIALQRGSPAYHEFFQV